MANCKSCGHSLKDNDHGPDQNDFEMDGDKCFYVGSCTYCKACQTMEVIDSPPPVGYVEWQEWSARQVKRGVKQRKRYCGRYHFDGDTCYGHPEETPIKKVRNLIRKIFQGKK